MRLKTKNYKLKTPPRLRCGGFTLIELIIYIALVAFILLAATAFSLEFAVSNAKASAIQEVNRNARFALARIELETREAKDLCPMQSVFNGTTAKLALLKNATGSCSPPDGADRIEFDLSGGQLRFKDGTATPVPLTSTRVNVTEFGLENLSISIGATGVADVVRIHLKVDYASTGNLQEYTASTVVETTATVQRGEGIAP